MVQETRYARIADSHVAYQVLGEGPDLVLAPTHASHLEMNWEEPRLARFLEKLSSFARLILFDKRGTGLSDPVPGTGVPTLEERMDDVYAVLDAVSSERAALFGYGEGGIICALFAATHPERTSSLVLMNTTAKALRSDDYPWGWEPGAVDPDRYAPGWSAYGGFDVIAPSLAEDTWFRESFLKMERLAASPGMGRALRRIFRETDIREALPAISCPALVIHRRDNRFIEVENGRYLAQRIPGAQYVELPGADHWPWFSDQGPVLEEIREFLTGVRSAPDLDRVLATVLFTDIVGSTAQAAEVGDRRWRDLLEDHRAMIRKELDRFRGREIDAVGDGFLATFDGPARAVRCAWAIGDAVRSLGIRIRAGVHTGECEVVSDDLTGIAVHIAARVAALAGPGEVLTSNTVKDLVVGSGIAFVDHGLHALKGVPDQWQLYAAER